MKKTQTSTGGPTTPKAAGTARTTGALAITGGAGPQLGGLLNDLLGLLVGDE
jgi:hypothetical protein